MAPRERIEQRGPMYARTETIKCFWYPRNPAGWILKDFFFARKKKDNREKKISGSPGIFFPRLGRSFPLSPEKRETEPRGSFLNSERNHFTRESINLWDIFNIFLWLCEKGCRARTSERNSCVDGNFPVLLSACRIFLRKFAIFKKLFHPYIEEGREAGFTFEFLIFSSFEGSRISWRK